MYEIQVGRVELSNFVSSSKFLNTNQMLICLFLSMHYKYKIKSLCHILAILKIVHTRVILRGVSEGFCQFYGAFRQYFSRCSHFSVILILERKVEFVKMAIISKKRGLKTYFQESGVSLNRLTEETTECIGSWTE